MAKMLFSMKIVLPMVLICLAKFGEPLAHQITTAEWDKYKADFDKYYPTGAALTEATAKYYYAYNKNLIGTHNRYEATGSRTFTLGTNQFSDMKLKQFNALFPKTSPLIGSYETPPPLAQPAPPAYDPIVDLGLTLMPVDQGTLCNSGWAYATARTIEILAAQQLGISMPDLMSAQNLIDCAGSGTGCRNQVPQQAFDYMAVHNQDIQTVADYPNMKELSNQGMCLQSAVAGTNLAKYSIIKDGNDDDMKKFVAAGFPVVIEVNPTTFEFMHYQSGVFQPPRTSTSGSHYMVVIGYGHDAVKNLDYWLVQNSFGELWGEMGRIRIIRNAANPLAKSAIFPTELA